MWTPTNQQQANAEGWRLVTTFNAGDSHPLWDVACHGGAVFATDRVAFAAVVDAAKRGGALHQHALKLVVASRARTPKGKKK